MVSAERQSPQMWESQAQNRRSNGVNLARLFAERRSTPIWCRRARFSSSRAARERKIERKAASSVERTFEHRERERYRGNFHSLRQIGAFENHKSTRQASTNEGIDNVHTGLREIDAVSRSDRQTVDNRCRCDEAILDRHGFPVLRRRASSSAHFSPVSASQGRQWKRPAPLGMIHCEGPLACRLDRHQRGLSADG
jgi:hypothetical protein